MMQQQIPADMRKSLANLVDGLWEVLNDMPAGSEDRAELEARVGRLEDAIDAMEGI